MKSRSYGLEAMKRESAGKCCIACDGPLPERHWVICGRKECKRTYHRIYAVDRHMREKADREELKKLRERLVTHAGD